MPKVATTCPFVYTQYRHWPDRQTDRQAGRQAGRQANRWTDGLTALLKQYHALHALHAYAHMDVLLYEEILLYFPFHLFV